MNKMVPLLLLLTACSWRHSGEEWQKSYFPEERAAIEEIQDMQYALAEAEQDLEKQRKYVEELRRSYLYKEIILIEERIAIVQENLQDLEEYPDAFEAYLNEHLHTLFAREREELAVIIDTYDEMAPQAQQVLDTILAMITKLSEKRE